MTFDAGFAISSLFGYATLGVFVLSLMAAQASRKRRPFVFIAFVCLANQIGTWVIQQYFAMSPRGMLTLDIACMVACVPARGWIPAGILAFEALLDIAHLWDDGSDQSYVMYVTVGDVLFGALLLSIAWPCVWTITKYRKRAAR